MICSRVKEKSPEVDRAIVRFSDNFSFLLLPFSGRVLGNVHCVIICTDNDGYLLFLKVSQCHIFWYI